MMMTTTMNKVVLLGVLATAALTGCSKPIPQNEWVKNTAEMKKVPGLEDCKFFEVQRETASHSIFVIRCPNSAVTTDYYQGKVRKTDMVIDEIANDNKDKQIVDLEARVIKLEKQIEKYQNVFK